MLIPLPVFDCQPYAASSVNSFAFLGDNYNFNETYARKRLNASIY
jgi:hypothetical protein